MNKKNWKTKVINFISESRIDRLTKYKVDGFDLEIYPDVFSPKVFSESLWFAERIAKIVGKKSLLEIGTGTGIISLFAAKKGANVTVTDINPFAIQNAKNNFRKNKLKANFYIGDLFTPLPKNKSFDFIFWNHPFNYSDKFYEDYLYRSVFDYKYISIKKYITEAGRYLNSNGQLLLGTSTIARIKAIERIVHSKKYEMELLYKTKVHSEIDHNVFVEYMIYNLIKQ